MSVKSSDIRTTFHGGEAEKGRIEFYEYSRSAYALARLIATVESFRRTGQVPKKVMSSANVEQYVHLPEAGSWSYVTNLFDAVGDKVKVPVSFNALVSWATGKALDDVDLFNSNTDAVIAGKPEIDLSLADADTVRSRKPRRTKAEIEAESAAAETSKKFTKRSLNKSVKAQKDLRAKRVSLETGIAVAREAKRNLAADPEKALAQARAEAKRVADLAARPDVQMFSEESDLVRALGSFAANDLGSKEKTAEQAARISYAANDLLPRLNRRLYGDRRVESDDIDGDELDQLAAKARPLLKDIVLPLRKSPTNMDLALGSEKRRIIHIDEVRGRMLSDSFLSAEAYDMKVFVIEFNRVTHSGKCRIQSMSLEVPFSLERQLVERLTTKAIDSLKARQMTFTVRPFVDNDGSIRSLLVQNIGA